MKYSTEIEENTPMSIETYLRCREEIVSIANKYLIKKLDELEHNFSRKNELSRLKGKKVLLTDYMGCTHPVIFESAVATRGLIEFNVYELGADGKPDKTKKHSHFGATIEEIE